MKCFKYVGDHADLQGEEALGRWELRGSLWIFYVQCHGHKLGTSVPTLLVDGEDWAHGWHETPRTDWQFVEQPKFRGTAHECAEFIRANRFGLLCDAWRDGGKGWVVFGDACS